MLCTSSGRWPGHWSAGRFSPDDGPQPPRCLAGAAYAALAVRPLETPVGTLTAPVLGGLATDPWSSLFVSLGLAAACGLAPDIDKAGSTASRSLGLPTRMLSWGVERSFGHRGGFHSLLAVVLAFVSATCSGACSG